MPNTFIHFTFLFFTLTAFSGMWMRFYTINPASAIPYTNILHGHSHLAMLGWAFLGVFIVFLSLFWKKIKHRKQATILVCSLFITSLLMFGAFLYQGYDVLSIITATIHIFIEYWAAVFMYRQLKGQVHLPKTGNLFIKSALLVLVISSIGPFALGYISANGLKDSYLFDMAMYFYLHFQYNGWLTLFLIGIFIIILHKSNIEIQNKLFTTGYWFYFVSLFPSYFLSILWIDLGSYSTILATIGSIGQWLGVIFILTAVIKTWRDIMQHFSRLTVAFLGITFFLLLFKSTMELGLISPALAPLVYETRSIVIGYLHLTLLGFVSMFILSHYLMINILSSSRLSMYGICTLFVGFTLNEILLFAQGLLEWLHLSGITFYSMGLLLASSLLFIGIVTLWLSFSKKTAQQ